MESPNLDEVKKHVETKINSEVDNIVISSESLKDLVVNLKKYNHKTQTLIGFTNYTACYVLGGLSALI